MSNFYLNEMKAVFNSSVKNLLKKRIKGNIKCHIIYDTLVIEIYIVNCVVFRYTRDNIISEIVHGLTSETVAETVVKKYKKHINSLYFY